ncbi:MAG: M14 family zinc carboxypeptidase [Caulobacterales bacterium]|uniref:M14 family zinc carboxypeptidase n=1 Tax=Glycocaulis sp. TaxID=1969725 RepID=UPI003FA07E92
MMLCRLVLVGLLTAFSGACLAQAYEPKPLVELIGQEVEYDAAIPLPEDVTGFAVGEIIYTPDMIAAYMRAVAAASDRVSVDTVGRSHFGRQIMRVTITAPENHARLDEIRAAQRQISEAGNTAAIPADHPVVIQFTHGVHGSEPSGYDSIMPLLYFLAAGQGAEVADMLDNSVIHLIGPINPDGSERFASWTNMHRARAPVADPQHREHYHEWPWGRVNHYWFDINRQWLPVTQPEAAALVQATREWLPNIAADFHEMGTNSTYFFSPGPPDGLHPLLSLDGLALNQRMNSFLNEQLDNEGALYVSEELFDDFYLGYGSSYPGLVGSVPYLFEQSSVRGLIQETDFGTLRYDDKIGQQARVGLALIRAGLANREQLLSFQRDFYREGARMANAATNLAYVFGSRDSGRLNDFLEILEIHGIEVYRLNRDTRINNTDFDAASSYVVPVRQREFRVVEALFETRIVEGMTEFYDVSGWTQPIAYGLDFAAVRPGLFAPDLTGERVTAIDRAVAAPEQTNYAYVIDWTNFYAPRALYRFLAAGVRARMVPDAITVTTANGEVSLPAGSVVIQVNQQGVNPRTVHDLVQRAAEDGVTVHAAISGATREGSDLGGFGVSTITRPEVLLLTGRGQNVNTAGEIWHLFDHELNIPVSMIDISEFSRADLSRYTHIILSDGSYGGMVEADATRLGEWTRAGGVLIGIEGGAGYAIRNGLTSAAYAEWESDSETPNALAYAALTQWDTQENVSGALFAADVDLSHPLLFGLTSNRLAVQRESTSAFAIGDNPFALPIRYARNGLISGYASQGNIDRLAGYGALHAERRGRGSVILFADNPYFRAYFRGSARVLTNAVFFGDSFRNPYRRAQ